LTNAAERARLAMQAALRPKHDPLHVPLRDQLAEEGHAA
jgi:hypothetical protein